MDDTALVEYGLLGGCRSHKCPRDHLLQPSIFLLSDLDTPIFLPLG